MACSLISSALSNLYPAVSQQWRLVIEQYTNNWLKCGLLFYTEFVMENVSMFNHRCYKGLIKPKTHTDKVLCTLYYVHNPLMHTTAGSYVVACSHNSGEFTTFIIPSRLIPPDGQQQFVWLYTWQTHRHITPGPSASKLIIALLSGLIGTSICPSISPATSNDSPRYPQCGAPEILRHSGCDSCCLGDIRVVCVSLLHSPGQACWMQDLLELQGVL